MRLRAKEGCLAATGSQTTNAIGKEREHTHNKSMKGIPAPATGERDGNVWAAMENDSFNQILGQVV